MNNGRQQALLDFRTSEARVIKAIATILEKNFTAATFIVTDRGMFVQENNGDAERNIPVTVILEVFLQKQFFDFWLMPTIESKDPDMPPGEICLGFSTTDLSKALAQVSKTDTIRMYVPASDHTHLYFDIVNSNNTMASTKWVTLMTNPIGRCVSPVYADHEPTVVVESALYKRTTTDANRNSKQKVRFSAQADAIRIEGTGTSIRGLKHVFGPWDDSKEVIYSADIATSRLHSFAAIATNNLAKTIQIYVDPDGNPIKISARAGNLGMISLYLQQEQDN